MLLNKEGIIANQCWLDIPKHFSNVTLDAYIIMPNHVHGIVIIDNEEKEAQVPTHQSAYPSCHDDVIHIETNTINNRKWKSDTLGVIINHSWRYH